jgi:aminopeptidase N
LFFEKVEPEALDWWWQIRVNYYEPGGYVNRTIYEPGGYNAYLSSVYLNGAVFMEELRALIGEGAFFAFLQDYAAARADTLTTADDFFSLLQQHTSQDLTPLLDRYFQD